MRCHLGMCCTTSKDRRPQWAKRGWERAACLLTMIVIFASAVMVTQAFAAESKEPSNRAGEELFQKRIRPALIKYCYECHSEASEDLGGGLLVDSLSGLLAGGDTGPAIVPKKPDDSLLVQAIEYRDLEMPPEEKLSARLIADVRRWISLGAPYPSSKDKDGGR